ncbi:MAG: T9SS type A sorting domain-containing protein [Ignavibacteria bacterium]|nr:T9SS type A sorting domain-containing protein [Ignavibacteria bacterium]
MIYIAGLSQIRREEVPVGEREYCVSEGDLQSQRNTPDITLRNGLPAICYQGTRDMTREIIYDGTSETESMLLHYYPIKIRMRNADGGWTGLDYNSNGIQTQENPDIEGSTNFDAFLINFSKANTTFYQFVKINSALYNGFSCSPGSFTGKDAKLIKGSYSGPLGNESKPGILTLSNPVNSIYTVGKQNISLVNNAPVYDGFSNLDGTIIKNNTQYAFTLGPIIASNTTSGFSDDTPPQTVHNAVEFNETMKSAVFTLSNNDTLILGAAGRYLAASSQAIQPMTYHINLVNSNSGLILRELFRDTINTDDSVGIEFLRGFVINNIDKGTDQFYVQLLIDTANASAASYILSGVYPDNTLTGGDAPKSYRTKVHFGGISNSMHSVIQLPKNYELSQNYPNPFNPSTTIKYALPKDGLVTIKVYDLTGREITRLVNEVKQAGYHSVLFNASNLSSGIYFYRIIAGDFIQTKKMLMIK